MAQREESKDSFIIVKKVREEFDEIAADRNKFNLRTRFDDRVVVHREITHSFVRADDVIGRDEEREVVVNFLMSMSDYDGVPVLPIIGLGGMGKTTLAKRVYNDERVVAQFDLRIWVCILEEFELEKVIKQILKSANVPGCDNLGLEQLQKSLRQTLKDKKYLLILDDVWNENLPKWIELKNLLVGGASGSKIVITTRNQSVSSIMATSDHRIEVQGLSHQKSLSLFLKWAFSSSQDANKYPRLNEIAEEIVKKCKGVPLAIRTLGSLLYAEREEGEWIKVRDNDIWKIEQKENGILPALKLSYYQLPTNLRRCFAFCSIFPKDYQFNSLDLISSWRANGMLKKLGHNQDIEDVGMTYIKQLLSRGFFQEFDDYGYTYEVENYSPISHFPMHEHPQPLPATSDHLTSTRPEKNKPAKHAKNRHQENSPQPKYTPTSHLPVHELPHHHHSQPLPTTSAHPIPTRPGKNKPAKHHREHSPQPTPPGAFTSTNALISFKMHDLVHDLALLISQRDCINLTSQRFPDDISTKRVRHVSFPRNYFSTNKIPNWLLEQKENIHTIAFPDGVGATKVSFVKDCISKFKSLRMLDLNRSRFEELPNSIGGLKHLKCLMLDGNNELKSLPASICEIVGLESLYFFQCSNIEKLPVGFGKLIRLRELGISTNESYLPENEMRCLKSLRNLSIEGCPNLKFVMSDDTIKCLSALRFLSIYMCESLVSLPLRGLRQLTRFETLFITSCKNLNLMMGDNSDTVAGEEGLQSLHSLVLEKLPKLEILPSWLLHGAKNLTHIKIKYCKNLTNLVPEGMVESFKSLKKLEIFECPKLVLLEGMQRLMEESSNMASEEES